LKPEQIASFEDMRKELETLKTYMFQDPQKLVDLKQLQKDYRELSFATSGYATKQELESKNAFTRDILYVSLALWGILFTVVGLPIIWRPRRQRRTWSTPRHLQHEDYELLRNGFIRHSGMD
jgi:hypothetical protein